jgi:hypothetical protein
MGGNLGKDGNEQSDGAKTGRFFCNGEEIDSETRIRQWLLDCRPPTTQSSFPLHKKQQRKRHSIDCEASAQKYCHNLLTTTTPSDTSDDARQVLSKSLSSRSEIIKTYQQQFLECREISRPSIPHNPDPTNDTVLYHPDFADWTTIKPAKDTQNQACDQPRSSSELLKVLDNATAALSSLLSAPFASNGDTMKLHSY